MDGERLPTLLLEHPIVGRLVRRTIFVAWDGDRVTETFRPAGDGSFVTAANETTPIADDVVIGLYHSALGSDALDAQWGEHLADYELVPLFAQLRRRAPPAAIVQGTTLTPPTLDPRNAFKVRSRAKSAGYDEVRGDGGYIVSFAKNLASTGRVLVIETDGIEPVPGAASTTHVTGMYLRSSGNSFGGPERFDWTECSAVLRAESWSDLCAVCAN